MEHPMNLHENKTLFRQAIQFTADQMQMPAFFVEKDYWVTLALNTIFKNKTGEYSVFKGGTALSKCFGYIHRFSEDIDLVLLRNENETGNQLSTKLKAISKIVETVMPEIVIDGLTRKMGMNRKTAHSYQKVFEGDFKQIRDVIVIEATWLGHFEPYTKKSISSFVGSMMSENGQDELVMQYGMSPFEVNVLEPVRTLCEKIMSLVRFSFGENPIEELKMKIRHTYDLHQLLKQEDLKIFFDSETFANMLQKVGQDDVSSFKNNNKWLIHHPANALFFNEIEKVWEDLRSTYNGDLRGMVYGEFPKESEVLETMLKIKKRLKDVSWEIRIDS